MIVVCDTFNPYHLLLIISIQLYLLINFGVSYLLCFLVVFNIFKGNKTFFICTSFFFFICNQHNKIQVHINPTCKCMHTQSTNKVVAPKDYYLLFDIKTIKVYTKLEANVKNANKVAFVGQALG